MIKRSKESLSYARALCQDERAGLRIDKERVKLCLSFAVYQVSWQWSFLGRWDHGSVTIGLKVLDHSPHEDSGCRCLGGSMVQAKSHFEHHSTGLDRLD